METCSVKHLVTDAGTLPCSQCKAELPAERFYVINGAKKARRDSLGVKRHTYCNTCQNQRYINLNPRKKMLYAARARANKLGVEFTITVNDIEIPTHCPVFGIPLEARIGQGRSNTYQILNSPSLDRIVNDKGYVPGNIAVISFRANLLKRDASTDELQAIVDYMRSRSQGD
jgi:hypothetical protein